jgi:autonomous glycyl radical cofactor GrcA
MTKRTWRKGDKKPIEAMRAESNKDLIYNIKKAVRFDTGSHRNVDGMRAAMTRDGVSHDEKTVVWVTNHIDKRISAIRDAQYDRLEVVQERLGV